MKFSKIALLSFLIAVFSIFSLNAKTQKKNTYVLIHGGWCASWCWDYNVKALEAKGNKVICLDLPGHGKNKPEMLENVHLKDHVNYVKSELKKIDGKVILAAHSMSGMIISQVAEDMSEKIEKLVYIAAFLPSKDGQVMTEFLASDPWTLVSPATTITMPNGLCTFNPRYARNMGFNTTNDKDFAFALSNMQLENPSMWSEPVHLTEKYHNVPKYYIHTLKDNCCSYYMQRVMVHNEPVVKQYYLDTDHCGMINEPKGFNEAMIDIGNDVVIDLPKEQEASMDSMIDAK